MSSRVVEGLFICIRLSARLSPAACGGRFVEKRDPTCARCPIGEEHEAGREPLRWPAPYDVPLERLAVRAFDRIPRRQKKTT